MCIHSPLVQHDVRLFTNNWRVAVVSPKKFSDPVSTTKADPCRRSAGPGPSGGYCVLRYKLSRPRRFDLADIESAVCRYFELPVNLLRSRSKDRGGSFGRALVAWLGQELGGTALNQVAKRYDRDQVTVSLGLKALRQRIDQNSKLKRDVESLLMELRTGQNKLKGTIPRPKELNN